MAFIFKILTPLALASLVLSGKAPGGYSYNRFSGPVSGQIVEVQVPAAEGIPAQQHADYGYDHNTGKIHPDTAKYAHLKTVDYVAKPDYSYAYGVEDPHTGNLQNHKEQRDGDVVRGEYSLVEPDGSIRLVRYTADPKNGFQATVHKKQEVKPSSPSITVTRKTRMMTPENTSPARTDILFSVVSTCLLSIYYCSFC